MLRPFKERQAYPVTHVTQPHEPDVSIIIPTYRRPDQLRACLDGIGRLDCGPHRYEVIVVDDAGTDGLQAVTAAFRDRMALRMVVQSNQGPGAARNAGAALAVGRCLAFIDDDCVPDRDWLTALVRALETRPDLLHGGRVVNGLANNPFSATTQLIASYVTEYYAQRRADERYFTTNNLALSAERFRELGGFDTTIPSGTAEDKEFCDRWRARGYRMSWVPDAVVHHYHHLTLWQFLRQHYNYGRGLLHFHKMRRHRGARRLAPEPLNFYRDLILYPLRERAPRRGWRFVLLLALSQAATGAGTVKAALGERLRRRPEATPAHGGADRADA